MRYIFFLITLCIVLFSCKTSKYPATGNYANKTKINIIGNYTEKEKKDLQLKLERQVDDSLQFTRKRKTWLGFFPYFIKVYHNFDSNSVSRTKDFFKAAFIANGYFRGGITTSSVEPIAPNSNAYNITFNAYPYQNHTIKNVSIKLQDSSLQQLATSIKDKSLLKKGDLYAQDLLDAERRRLVTHFRNEGYLFFTKEDMKIIADTVNIALLKIPNDPFEEQELLLRADSFNKKPTTDITIVLKNNIDPLKRKKYFVGNITLMPDNIDVDTTPPNKELVILNNKRSLKKQHFISVDSFYKSYYKDKYKNVVFKNKIFLNKGDLYKEINVEKTSTALNSLSNWQQVIINPLEKHIRNDTIDFFINMLPYNRFLSERKLEASYSQNSASNSFLTNLYGITASQSFKDRNSFHRAIQSTFTLNGSLEFGNNKISKQRIISSIQGGLNYSMAFPSVLLFKKINTNKTIESPKAIINTNVSYTSRLAFFRLTELGASYGSQFNKKTKHKLLNVQTAIPTIEYKKLNASDSLKKRIIQFPSLANIYRSGIIFSPARATLTYTEPLHKKQNPLNKTSTSVRYSAEFSGLGFKNILTKDLFSFIKLEYDRRFYIPKTKTQSLAVRFFVGTGISYNQSLEQNKTLPFFRQFIGGGPNSMRAWTVRTLSSYSTRTSSSNTINENFGDIQVETNFEYRYRWGKVLGIPILGALFVDAGNIWNWKAIEPNLVPANKSSLQRIGDDIAIASGTSVRFDFDYFIIRLDLGLKVKAPTDINGSGGWINKDYFSWSNNPVKLQLGIGYPF